MSALYFDFVLENLNLSWSYSIGSSVVLGEKQCLSPSKNSFLSSLFSKTPNSISLPAFLSFPASFLAFSIFSVLTLSSDVLSISLTISVCFLYSFSANSTILLMIYMLLSTYYIDTFYSRVASYFSYLTV